MSSLDNGANWRAAWAGTEDESVDGKTGALAKPRLYPSGYTTIAVLDIDGLMGMRLADAVEQRQSRRRSKNVLSVSSTMSP